jgi:hypothetical protein
MRKPIAAPVARPIPTLAAVLAGAAASPGCAPVECGETRADELRAHGSVSVDALREGRVRAGLREIAVATGALRHGATQVPEVHGPGEAPAVTPMPVPVPEPVTARGRVATVGPSPVQPPAPPERPRHRMRASGGPMRVTPRGE